MNPAAWIALVFGGATFVLNLVALAIGYGVLRGTVSALDARVKSLEIEIKTLNEVKVAVGEIKTALTFIKDQLAMLNAGLAPPPRRTPKAP